MAYPECFAVFGYTANIPDPKKPPELTINEDQAKVVRAIFKMASFGLPEEEIADVLSELGIPGPPEPWCKQECPASDLCSFSLKDV